MRKILAASLLTVFIAIFGVMAMGASFGSGIKAVYQGSGTVEVGYTAGLEAEDVTVTAVVMAKTVVQTWVTWDEATAPAVLNVAPVLTSTTNLRLYIGSSTAADNTIRYTWQIIEYY